MTVNITNYFENVTSIGEMLNVSNLVTGGIAWSVLLFMEFLIITVSMLGYGFPSAILASSFVCLISGIFLNLLGLVAWQHLSVYFGLIILTAIYINWNRISD